MVRYVNHAAVVGRGPISKPRRMRMRCQMHTALYAVVAGTITLGGCGGLLGRGGTSSDYQITTNREDYNRGSTGEATIRNTSDKTLQYSLCQRRLERKMGNSWVVAFEWPTAGGACTAEVRSLAEGASVNALFDVPTGLPAGTYRVVFTGL